MTLPRRCFAPECCVFVGPPQAETPPLGISDPRQRRRAGVSP
jgi:hypothetical protein